MRRGEVLGLRYSDVDFENNLIHIRQQIDRINGKIMARDVKTANSHRTLPLTESVRLAILAHAASHGVALPPFSMQYNISTSGTIVISQANTPLEPRNLARSFHDLIARAGLPRIKLHAMRHTAATMLKDLAVPAKDAQLILGHANISTTLNIYQHGTPDTHRSAMTAVEQTLLGA
jgi:integrase